jgi:hypothetical protein
LGGLVDSLGLVDGTGNHLERVVKLPVVVSGGSSVDGLGLVPESSGDRFMSAEAVSVYIDAAVKTSSTEEEL